MSLWIQQTIKTHSEVEMSFIFKNYFSKLRKLSTFYNSNIFGAFDNEKVKEKGCHHRSYKNYVLSYKLLVWVIISHLHITYTTSDHTHSFTHLTLPHSCHCLKFQSIVEQLLKLVDCTWKVWFLHHFSLAKIYEKKYNFSCIC